MVTKKPDFLTFGDGWSRYRRAARRVAAEAADSEMFGSHTCWSMRSLRRAHPGFVAEHHRMLRRDVLGFGYWIWKPLLIQAALQHTTADFVVYADSGCVVNSSASAKRRMGDYLEMASESSVLLTQVPYRESDYSKQDLLLALDADDQVRSSRQLQAGFLVIRRNKISEALISEWLRLCTLDNYRLVDDSPSTAPNAHGFIEHRHDQSVFSVLCKSAGLTGIPNETNHRDLEADGLDADGRAQRAWHARARNFPIWTPGHCWGTPFSPAGVSTVRYRNEQRFNHAEVRLRGLLQRSCR